MKPDIKYFRNGKAAILEELLVPYGEVRIPVNEITDDMLEDMKNRRDYASLERVCEARERLIDLLFRSGW